MPSAYMIRAMENEKEHPKAPWFRGQALECIRLAMSATDARIKRLHAAEAERWLLLAQLRKRTELPRADGAVSPEAPDRSSIAAE
jgi:hypothetical protein